MSSPGKRQVSGSAPESSPSRRKMGSSDQTDSSNLSNPSNIFSPRSGRNSRTSRDSEAMMSPQAIESQDTADYYEGLVGNPKLLARSSRNDWKSERPFVKSSFGGGGKEPALKKMFVITNKNLQRGVTAGRRKNVTDIILTMNPMCCIAVDYVRIGYFEDPSKNPAVILITVEQKAGLSPKEAQRIVDEVNEVFLRSNVSGFDVEVVEGHRSGLADEEDPEPEERDDGLYPLPPPVEYPHVGASIALRRDMAVASGVGTLAGYVEVDGKVYGLTNHHVVLGSDRKEAFPTRAEKKAGTRLVVVQPATLDLEELIQKVKSQRTRLSSKTKKTKSDEEEIKKLDSHIESYKSYLDRGEDTLDRGAKAQMGTVFQTSGKETGSVTTTGHCHRMDWALIELDNPARFKDPELLVNELPSSELNRICKPHYVKEAMKLGRTPDKTIDDFSSHLKRHLTTKEFRAEQDAVENRDKQLVVWKVGRSTHYTHGASSEIKSNFVSADLMVSDEWLVLDTPAHVPQRIFSAKGDSGSFIWTSDGFVAGLLWGRRTKAQQTYVTPIEAVLDDIKKCCHAKEEVWSLLALTTLISTTTEKYDGKNEGKEGQEEEVKKKYERSKSSRRGRQGSRGGRR
ncbi:uncharacterized protein RCO7_00720 [Rhynchosporium graminicola]|uniref:Serine protease n=1 Tax=Rhynchosporium graminicola TaxID=2792576 RepID=A0A1E1K1Z2_9HELO|nr:uncharacterized protein RCO7_00720 [Rhynchosporium commune]